MKIIDLGNPGGYAVMGVGSQELADELGGAAVGQDAEAYRDWVESTRCGQIAPECGAVALVNTEGSYSVGSADDSESQ